MICPSVMPSSDLCRMIRTVAQRREHFWVLNKTMLLKDKHPSLHAAGAQQRWPLSLSLNYYSHCCTCYRYAFSYALTPVLTSFHIYNLVLPSTYLLGKVNLCAP